jgi:hypothetical protein
MNEKKIKPMPKAVYKINMWSYKLYDLFQNPKRHLEKIPLREGMTVSITDVGQAAIRCR